ncbi:MAG TPA: hypothetical protein VG722_12135 [Tepidisphaeraceae bacterium]|nr:hypothetical protein [Tepidisphaeraceae bacterium]
MRLDRRLVRFTLVSFLFTFLIARICVFLIMSQRMPDLYFYVGQTHVHHLNYGIFLLVGLTAYLLFFPPKRPHVICGIIYGIALGLTFDEFGMWIHLGGSYWQWASFHACVLILSLLLLLGFAPSPKQFRLHHVGAIVTLAVLLGIFFWLFPRVSQRYQHLEPRLQQLEQKGPQ